MEKTAPAKLIEAESDSLCIAGDYAKYDLHAVPHIGRNIELITYRHYGGDLLLLDYYNRRKIKKA